MGPGRHFPARFQIVHPDACLSMLHANAMKVASLMSDYLGLPGTDPDTQVHRRGCKKSHFPDISVFDSQSKMSRSFS